MSFVLPNPTTPQNGQPGDATPILENELAIAQAIAAFDGSQINTKTVTENALADAINPRLRGSETLANFVYAGCIWSQVSGLIGTMTGGTIYVNGYRTIVTGVGSNTFAGSTDTYIDIDYLGNVTYNAVANNATSPSLTPNAIRVAKIITSGSAITTVTQSGYDANFVPIASHNAAALSLANTVQSYTSTGAGAGTGFYINLGGIKWCWGQSGSFATTSGNTYGVGLPPNFFTTIQTPLISVFNPSNVPTDFAVTSASTSAINVFVNTNNASCQFDWFVIGT